MWKLVAVLSLASVSPALASADYKKINDRTQFVKLVKGKELSRPFVRLRVSPEGDISGRGVRWDVNGSWTWRDGYFCRDLNWGGSDLGYNCQEVGLSKGKIRFTSDKGRGASADFRLD